VGMASQRIASQPGMHREFLVTSQVTQIEMEGGSFIHKSCCSIRQSEVPQSSTDANGIILKINFAIAEDSALARKPRENEAFPRALGGGNGHRCAGLNELEGNVLLGRGSLVFG
jgi:hypothetical protein